MAATTAGGGVEVRQLQEADEAALDELLEADPVVNLFLRGYLAAHPMDRGLWYGVEVGERLIGAALLLPHRLCVPWAPTIEGAERLGEWLARRHRPTMMVGPRDTVDLIWEYWGKNTTPKRFYDQRLYRVSPPSPPETVLGFRPARLVEWPLLAARATRMEWEDLGRDPGAADPELHAKVVRDRIQTGRTFVLEREGEVVFQVNVGTATPEGAQVGGTYVPPRFRQMGYAIEGMRGLVQTLVAKYPVVTLHVNEANVPAVKTYERVGFSRDVPYRLVTV